MLVLNALVEAKRAGITFSQLMVPICRYANSGELNFRVADKEAAIQAVRARMTSFGTLLSCSEMDGVRMDFANGWVCVRSSNTEPFLRLIIEAEQAELLAQWQRALTQTLDPFCEPRT